MRKIAILTSGYKNDSYEDYTLIIEKVTDFAEVDEETYKLLNEAQWDHGFRLVEIPLDTKAFVLDTVEKYKKFLEEEKRKKEAEKEKKAKQRAENILKQKAKTEEQEKLLLKQLAKKHGLPQL